MSTVQTPFLHLSLWLYRLYCRLFLGESIEVKVKTGTMDTALTLKALKDENKHQRQRAEEPLKPLSLTKTFSGAVASCVLSYFR